MKGASQGISKGHHYKASIFCHDPLLKKLMEISEQVQRNEKADPISKDDDFQMQGYENFDNPRF